MALKRSAPFSTHARGVPLFDKSFAGAQRTLTNALLDLRDMGSSIFWFLSMQSWLTLWSCIINIVSGASSLDRDSLCESNRRNILVYVHICIVHFKEEYLDEEQYMNEYRCRCYDSDIRSILWNMCESNSWWMHVILFCLLGAVVFYNFYRSKGLSAQLDLVLIEFVVVLPLIGFIWMLQKRRNYCLDLLSEVKCGLLYVVRTFVADYEDMLDGNALPQDTSGRAQEDQEHEEDDIQQGHLEHMRAVSHSIMRITSSMHDYFLPSRFYSTRYPYLGYKSAMFQIALDRSNLQKRMKRGLEDVDALARTSEFQENKVLIRSLVYKLHVAIDKLCNVKEFGTPQGIRSMVRCYICIIIPVFFGPYWASISEQADFAVAFFVSLAFQIALTGLLNVAITLEDPFDNVGLCGIFIDEQLFEVESALQRNGLLQSVDGPMQEHGTEAPRGDTDPTLLQEEPASTQRVVRVATDNV